MIDLARLTIKKGDIVKRKYVSEEGNYEPFVVSKVEIDGNSLEQLVYSEFGPPVKASELEIVEKDDSSIQYSKEKQTLENILNSIYGDRWDIQILDDEGYSLFGSPTSRMIIMIHYPEITIRNSKNSEHFIRDLFVAIPLGNNYQIRGNVYGARTSFTINEKNVRYAHSHLPNPPGERFSSFCTGGDILDEALALAVSSNPYKDPIKYEQFFELLNMFVQWESLEGGPYRRMSNIRSGSGRLSLQSYLPEVSFGKLLSFLKKKNFILPITMDFNLPEDINYQKLIDIPISDFNEKLKDFLIENLEEAIEEKVPVISLIGIKEGFSYYKLNGNNELRQIIANKDNLSESEKIIVEERGDSIISFRGEKIKLKEYITRIEDSNLSIENLGISNQMIRKIVSNLKIKFYERFFEKGEEFISELKSPNGEA